MLHRNHSYRVVWENKNPETNIVTGFINEKKVFETEMPVKSFFLDFTGNGSGGFLFELMEELKKAIDILDQ